MKATSSQLNRRCKMNNNWKIMLFQFLSEGKIFQKQLASTKELSGRNATGN